VPFDHGAGGVRHRPHVADRVQMVVLDDLSARFCRPTQNGQRQERKFLDHAAPRFSRSLRLLGPAGQAFGSARVRRPARAGPAIVTSEQRRSSRDAQTPNGAAIADEMPLPSSIRLGYLGSETAYAPVDVFQDRRLGPSCG